MAKLLGKKIPRWSFSSFSKPVVQKQETHFSDLPPLEEIIRSLDGEEVPRPNFGTPAFDVQLLFDEILKSATGRKKGIQDEKDAAELHKLKNFWISAYIIVGVALCLGGLVAMAWIIRDFQARQDRLAESVINSERRVALELGDQRQAVRQEMAVVSNKVSDQVNQMQAFAQDIQGQQDVILKRERAIVDQVGGLTDSLSDEKVARQQEMTLILNLTRTRLNNLEDRLTKVEEKLDKESR